MNAFVKQSLAAAALALAVAGPASALTADMATGSLYGDVQSALSSSGNVNVSVRDGVATLTGYTSALSKAAAERAALASPGVDSVINLVQQSG